MSDPMENDRCSDGRLARPVSARACASRDARRSTSNIRNFCPATDSIKEALGIEKP
jgi:hypothetical protein